MTARRIAMDTPPEVSAWLAQVAHHGLAENTHRAYQSDRRFFGAWHRVRFGIAPPLPIAEAVVISFVADCLATLPADLDAQLHAHSHKMRTGPHTLATVQRRLSGLHTWHLEAGLPSACRSDSVRQLLRRSRRTLRPLPPERSQPITLAVLQRLLLTCDDRVRGQRDRALLLVGWCCGGRRRSELAA